MPGNHSSCGVVLIVILMIITLGMASLLLSELNRPTSPAKQQMHTARVLAQAKSALLGFAGTYTENHPGQPQGYLPCPDKDGDGSSDPELCSAKGKSVIGRFPWRTLGLPPLRDGSGECLWYAVSGTYKDRPKQALTSDTDGLLIVKNALGGTLAGATPKDRAIAILFAPGRPLANQKRRTFNKKTLCGSQTLSDPSNQANNYLDSLNDVNNANGTLLNGNPYPSAMNILWFISAPNTKKEADNICDLKYASTTGDLCFNDTLLLITPNDFKPIYKRMDRWVAQKVYYCLKAYANANDNKYPWAAPLEKTPSPPYNDESEQRFGHIPDDLTNTQKSNNAMHVTLKQIPDPDPKRPKTFPLECGTPYCFDDAQSSNCSGSQDKEGYWWWWKAWREVTFFAINDDNSPKDSDIAAPGLLTLNGDPENMIIAVASRTLPGKERLNNDDKTNVNNYLEGGNELFKANVHEAFFNTLASLAFNDTLCGSEQCL